MGGLDESRARAILTAMLERLASGPHVALGIQPTATPAEIRSAFLELTKTYHPARFGYMSSELQRLSNEVFLSLRAAHDALARPARAQAAARTDRSGAYPAVASRSDRSGNFLRSDRSGNYPRNDISGNYPRNDISGNYPRADAAPGANPPSGSFPPAGSSPVRMPPAPARSQPPGLGTGSGTAAPPGSSAPDGRGSTPPSGVRLGVMRAPGAVAPRAGLGRPAGALGTAGVPIAPIASAPSPLASAPGPLASAPGPLASAPSASAPVDLTNDRELAAVLEQLQRGQWDAARAALSALAARAPDVPRYRALIAYARGREAQLAHRLDEARVELQDALQLDPDLQVAKTALAELFTRRR